MIDLDAKRAARAAKREGAHPEGLPVRFKEQDYLLPTELPVAILDPLFDGEFDLTEVLRLLVPLTVGTEEAGLAGVLDSLARRPDLPAAVLAAVRMTLAALFGPDQWERFWSAGPSFPDMIELVGGLVGEYGVSLGESPGSDGPSTTDGATSSQISGSTATLTPDASGVLVATPS